MNTRLTLGAILIAAIFTSGRVQARCSCWTSMLHDADCVGRTYDITDSTNCAQFCKKFPNAGFKAFYTDNDNNWFDDPRCAKINPSSFN